MALYSLTQLAGTVRRNSDGAYIPADDANIDRQAYNDWLADGNIPDPATPLLDPLDNTFGDDPLHSLN